MVPTVIPLGGSSQTISPAMWRWWRSWQWVGQRGSLGSRRGQGILSWVGSSGRADLVAALGIAAALALAIPVSQSRGGVLSLIAGLVALFVLWVRRGDDGSVSRSRWATAAIGVVLMIIAAQAVLPPEANQRMATLTSSTIDTSATFRLRLWRDTLRAAGAGPMAGQGLGAFQDALPRFKQGAGELRVEHAENDYLELLVEGGAIAGLALAAFLWQLFKGLAKPAPHRGVEHGLRLGATAGGIALGVHSFMDFNLHIPASALLACFLLALVSKDIEGKPLEGRPARALGTCGLLIFVAVGWGLARPQITAAPISTALGGKGLRAKHSEAALQSHLRERPADAEAWAWLAWLKASGGARTEGAALAGHAVRLDPTRQALKSFAQTRWTILAAEGPRLAVPHRCRALAACGTPSHADCWLRRPCGAGNGAASAAVVPLHSGIDAWFYLLHAEALWRQHRLPARLSQYLLADEEQRYPPVFPLCLRCCHPSGSKGYSLGSRLAWMPSTSSCS